MNHAAPRARPTADRHPAASLPFAGKQLLMEKIPGAAARLDVSRSTIYRLIAEGRLRTVKLSARAVRVVSADVDALVQQAA